MNKKPPVMGWGTENVNKKNTKEDGGWGIENVNKKQKERRERQRM